MYYILWYYHKRVYRMTKMALDLNISQSLKQSTLTHMTKMSFFFYLFKIISALTKFESCFIL